MNIPSVLSNSSFKQSSHLTLTDVSLYDPSMFYTTSEPSYFNYQYDTSSRPILNYSEYATDNYNIPEDYIPYQPPLPIIYPPEQVVNTNKIFINPFFRPQSLNRTSESSSEIEKDCSTSTDQQHKSSPSSRSRSRSPPPNRQLPISSDEKRKGRQRRLAQRQKFLQEKELMFKRKSLLLSKPKHHRSTPDRWEHKDEQLHRLYEEYSTEDTYKQWKPLLLKQCFELYRYAFDKHHGTSVDNSN